MLEVEWFQSGVALGLHTELVNRFVQIGAYDNQEEKYQYQQKVFLDLHR
jgi:hypothetical protein